MSCDTAVPSTAALPGRDVTRERVSARNARVLPSGQPGEDLRLGLDRSDPDTPGPRSRRTTTGRDVDRGASGLTLARHRSPRPVAVRRERGPGVSVSLRSSPRRRSSRGWPDGKTRAFRADTLARVTSRPRPGGAAVEGTTVSRLTHLVVIDLPMGTNRAPTLVLFGHQAQVLPRRPTRRGPAVRSTPDPPRHRRPQPAPTWQQWAGQVIGVLYEAAVAAAQAYGRDHLHVHMQVNIRTRRAAVEASP